MEFLGGFIVMMSIIGLFLAVVWLIIPFIVFTIKGKQDQTLEVLEVIEKRLAAIENHLQTKGITQHTIENAAACQVDEVASKDSSTEKI